ncbi:MAG: hypothetical protein R2714_01275 [Microthrixaceae bacterium]
MRGSSESVFSGNEWLIVVVFAAVAVFVVWAVVRSVQGGAGARILAPQTALVRGEPGEVLADLQLALAGLKATPCAGAVAGWSPWNVKQCPSGRFLLPSCSFLGLVALVARSAETATIAATNAEPGTTELRMAGVFRSDSVAAINGVIATRSE